MQQIEEKMYKQQERVFKRWKLEVLGTFCDKAEQAIAIKEDGEEKDKMQQIFEQAEKIYSNRMIAVEDDLMDRN